jgi:hypothetical protein
MSEQTQTQKDTSKEETKSGIEQNTKTTAKTIPQEDAKNTPSEAVKQAVDQANQLNQGVVNEEAKRLAEARIQAIAEENKSKREEDSTTKYIVKIECSIRRKPGLTGLPGADIKDRLLKLGASLDTVTRGALKGVTGELEKLIMPDIVGVSANDYGFKEATEQYWSNIGVNIPSDEDFQKEQEKGRLINITLIVKGSLLKEKIDTTLAIKEKMAIVEEGAKSGKIEIDNSSFSDFLLLAFALKHSRVAATPELVGNSPKIQFYIFNKATAVKAGINSIQLRNKAIKLFDAMQHDTDLLDAVLILFKEEPTSFDTIAEKVIAVDEHYMKTPENMNKFINFVTDDNWRTKTLIKVAVNKGKLSNPANTDTYYYNSVLLGKTLDETVLFLNSGTSDANNIKQTLKQEINI